MRVQKKAGSVYLVVVGIAIVGSTAWLWALVIPGSGSKTWEFEDRYHPPRGVLVS